MELCTHNIQTTLSAVEWGGVKVSPDCEKVDVQGKRQWSWLLPKPACVPHINTGMWYDTCTTPHGMSTTIKRIYPRGPAENEGGRDDLRNQRTAKRRAKVLLRQRNTQTTWTSYRWPGEDQRQNKHMGIESNCSQWSPAMVIHHTDRRRCYSEMESLRSFYRTSHSSSENWCSWTTPAHIWDYTTWDPSTSSTIRKSSRQYWQTHNMNNTDSIYVRCGNHSTGSHH